MCFQSNETGKEKSQLATVMLTCHFPGRARTTVQAVRCMEQLGVEGEDTLMIATDEEDGRQVLRQGFQPGHVESAGHSTFACNWETHDNDVSCARVFL